MFKDGSSYLKISPKSERMTGTSSNVSGFVMGSSSSNSTPPWPLSEQRSDQEFLEAINNGSVTVHSSRFPMSSTDLRIMLNNIQVALGLTIGLHGEWSLKADQKKSWSCWPSRSTPNAKPPRSMLSKTPHRIPRPFRMNSPTTRHWAPGGCRR